jgi:hypothetical protein
MRIGKYVISFKIEKIQPIIEENKTKPEPEWEEFIDGWQHVVKCHCGRYYYNVEFTKMYGTPCLDCGCEYKYHRIIIRLEYEQIKGTFYTFGKIRNQRVVEWTPEHCKDQQ